MSLFRFAFLIVPILLATCQAEKILYKALMLSKVPKNNISVEQDGLVLNINLPPAYSDYETLKIYKTPPVFSQAQSVKDTCEKLKGVIEGKATKVNSRVTITLQQNISVFHLGIVLKYQGEVICGTILPVDSKMDFLEILTYRFRFYNKVLGDIYIRQVDGSKESFIYAKLYHNTNVRKQTFDLILKNQESSNIIWKNIPIQKYDGLETIVASIGLELDALSDSSKLILQPTRTNEVLDNTEGRKLKEKSAKADISSNNIIITVQFKQQSIFDPTLVEVSKILSSFQHSIHKYPALKETKTKSFKCSNDNIGKMYTAYEDENNPYFIGNITHLLDNQLSKYSPLITLFGVNSIVGRSFVIEKDDTRECVTINGDIDYITAVVNFRKTNYGVMYFRQEKSDPFSDTTVYGSLANYDGVETNNHKFHVHINSVKNNCGETQGHYDPIKTSKENSYSTRCNPLAPERCEVGDLGLKFRRLTLGSSMDVENSKMFHTDSFLPLSGTFSILKRSIVIHMADIQPERFSCSNIFEIKPVEVITKEWKPLQATKLNLKLSLKQNSPFDFVKVSWSGNTTANLSIYSNNLNQSSDKCDINDLGGVYDPFDIRTSEKPPSELLTQDLYKVGSLSKKKSLSKKLDTNLQLFTEFSVAGRSVVLNSKLCDQLYYSSGSTANAGVKLMSDQMNGFVRFSQVITDEGNAVSVTGLEIYLKSEQKKEIDITYTIHESSNGSSCIGIGDTYDPYKIKTGAYNDYCNSSNQLACTVGDLTRKHGIYKADKGRKFFNDINLPLDGRYSILGRSIKISNPTLNDTCAVILPPANRTFTICFPQTVEYDHNSFLSKVSHSLQIPKHRILKVYNKNMPHEINKSCKCVIIYIIGDLSTVTSNKLKNKDLKLSKYNPGKCPVKTGIVMSYTDNASIKVTSFHFSTLIIISILSWFLF